MAGIRLRSQDLSIVGPCVKRVCGRNAEVEAKKNRESVESSRMCLFVEGDQHHNKNLHQFRPIASKNNTTVLQRFPQFFSESWSRL